MSQNEDLKKIADGVVNFCGEMRTYLEKTKESFDRVLNANYHVNTAPIITKTLEQEYEDILATNGDYEYSSAVGYRAILKNGDTVKATVNSGNSGHFFLNGERMTADYTYTGDGCEMVSVWVFENIGSTIVVPPTLNDTPSFTPYEINIKNIGQTPIVNNAYYLYTSKIETYNFTLSTTPRGCKILTANGTSDFTQLVPITVQEVESNCNKLTTEKFASNSYIKKIKLPNCEVIGGKTGIFMSNPEITDWEFGKLNKIYGGNGSYAVFQGVNTVLIPDTVKTLDNYSFGNCQNVKLECNKATNIGNSWYKGTVPTNFTMAKDWLASVNISLVASNWSKDKFIDLFENYLFDLSVVGEDGTLYAESEITIPNAIYNTLTEEEFAIAENKNWIVGGA